MTTTPTRIGIVGCGSVMQGPYTGQIKRMQHSGMAVEVTRACDVVPERAAIVRSRFGDIPFSTDYRDVTEAQDVDLVLVLTAMPAHGLVAKAGLEAGKHVLVEKPMAVTLEQAAELVELARHSSGLLLPAPHVLLSPTYQTIWRRVKRGDIGQVLQARARYGWDGPSWGQWFYRPGGGSMFDLGVYNVIALTGIFGPAKRVTAMVGAVRPQRVVDDELIQVQTDDTAHILLDFGGDLFAVVTTGFTMQRYRSPAIELYGSDGVIQMLGDDWDPDGYELWQNKIGAWQIFAETHPDWPWTDGLRHMVECIQTGTTPIITPEHGFHALEIMEAARAAGRDGQARTIASSFTLPTFAEPAVSEAAHRVHDRAYR